MGSSEDPSLVNNVDDLNLVYQRLTGFCKQKDCGNKVKIQMKPTKEKRFSYSMNPTHIPKKSH